MELILNGLQTAMSYVKIMKISDFVDIAIMAYVIYRVLLLIRRSRSGQVAQGYPDHYFGSGRFHGLSPVRHQLHSQPSGGVGLIA